MLTAFTASWIISSTNFALFRLQSTNSSHVNRWGSFLRWNAPAPHISSHAIQSSTLACSSPGSTGHLSKFDPNVSLRFPHSRSTMKLRRLNWDSAEFSQEVQQHSSENAHSRPTPKDPTKAGRGQPQGKMNFTKSFKKVTPLSDWWNLLWWLPFAGFQQPPWAILKWHSGVVPSQTCEHGYSCYCRWQSFVHIIKNHYAKTTKHRHSARNATIRVFALKTTCKKQRR